MRPQLHKHKNKIDIYDGPLFIRQFKNLRVYRNIWCGIWLPIKSKSIIATALKTRIKIEHTTLNSTTTYLEETFIRDDYTAFKLE